MILVLLIWPRTARNRLRVEGEYCNCTPSTCYVTDSCFVIVLRLFSVTLRVRRVLCQRTASPVVTYLPTLTVRCLRDQDPEQGSLTFGQGQGEARAAALDFHLSWPRLVPFRLAAETGGHHRP